MTIDETLADVRRLRRAYEELSLGVQAVIRDVSLGSQPTGQAAVRALSAAQRRAEKIRRNER